MYSYNAKIISKGRATAEQITQYYRDNAQNGLDYVNRQRKKRNLPPLPLNPIPDNIGEIIIQASRTWPQYEVNSDMVATQGGKESAFLQSEIARDKFNPSGLGASNDNPYENAIDCGDWLTGFILTVSHLLSYAVGEGPWTEIDPRWKYMKPGGNAPRWIDLNGKWAYPGTNYGQSIIDRANEDLLSTEVAMGDDPRFMWVPDVSEFGYPKGTRGRNGYGIDYVVIHITAGVDSLGWLTGNNGNSAHYLSDRSFKPRAQMVLEADAAWTGGSREYNLRGIHFEFEIRAGVPISDEMLREAADTVRPIAERNNIPMTYLGRDNANKRGFIGHSDIPDPDGTGWGGSGNHTDPGEHWDWEKFMAYVRSEQPDLPEVPTLPNAEPDPWRDSNPWNKDFWILTVFVNNINDGNWIDTGYCISEAFLEDGLIVQYFERAKLEWNGTYVTRALLGLESLVGRYPERKYE